MSHDVYGSNLPTFAEFFGPIAVPVVVMLLVLAGLSWGTLRSSRTPRIFDALLWFITGLGITIFFGVYSQDRLGDDEYALGSIGAAWLVSLSGMGVNLARLGRQCGSKAWNQSLMLVGCACVLLACTLSMSRGGVLEAARRTHCKNNLKQIGLALHNYHDTHKSFPMQMSGDPPQSWRLHLVRYFDANIILNEYRFDCAWDSPENADFAKKRFPVYQCPTQKHNRDDQGRFLTSYALMYGPQGIWRDDRQPLPLNRIKDGTSNTIAVMEACGQNIVWNEPRDLDGTTTPAAINLRGETRYDSPAIMSSLHWGGAHLLMADGTVRFISQEIDPKVLQALVTADGGDKVGEW